MPMSSEHPGEVLLERGGALSALDAAFGAVVAGRGGIALVSGEAGIGKSSLVRAFVAAERRATRVLAGGCDDLAVPRPLGPFLEVAGELPGLASELGTGGVDAPRIVLDELRRDGPTICIVEDAHWADEATIDVLTFVARRVEAIPALLVVSFRDDEVGPDHPLRRALAATPAGCTHRLALERLSVEAVGRLAGADADATSLHAITGGNPFFVCEALTSGPGRTPASVRDAVLGRAARLSYGARAVAELVSVIPFRAALSLVEECEESAGSVRAGLAECERRGLLELDHDLVGFRHELARWAVEECLAAPRRRDLNRVVLHALKRRDATPARLAHHAWSCRRRRRDRAARPRRGTRRGRGALASRSAGAAGPRARVRGPAPGAGSVPRRSSCCPRRPTTPISRSAPCRRGNARWRSAVSSASRWPRARRCAGCRASTGWRATAPLPSAPPRTRSSSSSRSPRAASWRWRSATAHSSPCSRNATTRRCAGGSGRSRWRAGSATPKPSSTPRRTSAWRSPTATSRQAWRWSTTPRGWRSTRASTSTPAARWSTRPGCSRTSGRTRARGRCWSAAQAFAREREIVIYLEYLAATRALIDLATGDWDTAAAAAAELVAQPRLTNWVARIPALEVVGLVGLRRGQPGAHEHLDEAWELARATGELQRLRPIACARAEAAWLEGDARAVDAATRDTLALAHEVGHEWDVGEIVLWRFRAGLPAAAPESCPLPIACELAGDARGAARHWAALGEPYAEALALLGASDPEPLLDGIALLDRLGATAVAAFGRARLRRAGVTGVPRGPRPATRANPAGLTARQLEVLELVTQGLSNPQIARRLFLSPKTVEHHVAAILVKLGVRSRGDVASAARRLGVDGARPS